MSSAPPRAPRPFQSRPTPAKAAPPKPFRICGLPAVAAVFARDPDRVQRLFYEERHRQAVGPFCARLAEARKPYRLVEKEELDRVAGTPLHGGVVAVAEPRQVLPFNPDWAKRWAAEGRPLLLLDGIGNPHNLGAIVRTAAFFGLDRLVISDHPEQAQPSESAYRVAEGGFEYVQIYRADRFATAVRRLAESYRVVGTALGGHPALGRLTGGPKPPAVLLGNEEDGLPAETLRACAELATIPGAGQVQSLNVAATAAILAWEMTRP
ncbi:TrmH family RNA methyltransferase [Rhodospirillum centenum]|uniref:RNA methyltransferase, TrmH family n=1 Tax=Rhodospirillum centenum (strain ATCC 51521 / SW) TaxID=414684 RepID=B6IWB6_RHOCS|nr:RNA methyltransferase [Rhodospirillum centenum]ACJ00590.1 RNA methyltransferase, TrmH family [Rhodospirillum centenum SW]